MQLLCVVIEILTHLLVVSTYIRSEKLLQSWDLYVRQLCCAQKLWGAPNLTICQFLDNVAL